MVQDDIMFHILKFAYDNKGVFKNSSFKYIADPPRTWQDRRDLLERMVQLGYFEKYKVDGGRVYTYRLTVKGREALIG